MKEKPHWGQLCQALTGCFPIVSLIFPHPHKVSITTSQYPR